MWCPIVLQSKTLGHLFYAFLFFPPQSAKCGELECKIAFIFSFILEIGVKNVSFFVYTRNYFYFCGKIRVWTKE